MIVMPGTAREGVGFHLYIFHNSPVKETSQITVPIVLEHSVILPVHGRA